MNVPSVRQKAHEQLEWLLFLVLQEEELVCCCQFAVWEAEAVPSLRFQTWSSRLTSSRCHQTDCCRSKRISRTPLVFHCMWQAEPSMSDKTPVAAWNEKQQQQ